IPGSTMVMYRADDDDEFVSLPLTHVTGDTYRAVLPAPRCGQTPQFYFTAAGVDSGVVTYPFGAPENVLTFDVGVDELPFADDFETDQGWTVQNIPVTSGFTGAWE